MVNEWLHRMDGVGLTPLDRAFNCGHMALAELLLRQEKVDGMESLVHASPLHRAAGLGLSDAVCSLLSYGASPTVCDEQGETPLHKAARRDDATSVALLSGASDVNARCSAGMTPLHWACISGATESARLLLDAGSDPHLRNESADGLSPIEIAESMGYKELVKLIEGRTSLV